LPADVARALAVLNRAGPHPDVADLGDPTLLETRVYDVSATEVANQFGERFAAQVATLPINQWHGPIDSSYGAHVVRVTTRASERLPELDEIRDAVRREYANTRRLDASERFYASLRRRYSVTVEAPPQPLSRGSITIGDWS
jgi:hypothetical protein